MRCYPVSGALVLVLLLAMIGLPVPSPAQAIAGSTDFRGRSSYSTEDLAQALFPQETPSVDRRGIGSPQARSSLLIPRAVVILNVLFGSNADALPSHHTQKLTSLARY